MASRAGRALALALSFVFARRSLLMAMGAGIDAARVYKVSDGCFKIRPVAIAEVESAKPPKAAKAKRIAKAPAPKMEAAVRKTPVQSTKEGTKGAQLIEMITRGATTTELTETLGWQRHTLRAALSRLGSAGYDIERTKVGTKDDGFESHYKIG